MGIYKRQNGKYYIRCDFELCQREVELKSKSFWEAVDEAKRLGWKTRKTPSGSWVNFCMGFCEECYFAPQITVRIKKKPS